MVWDKGHVGGDVGSSDQGKNDEMKRRTERVTRGLAQQTCAVLWGKLGGGAMSCGVWRVSIGWDAERAWQTGRTGLTGRTD